MSKSFCLLDNTMTLHGLRFKPEGVDLSRFVDNPILLYMHTRGEVHGKWTNVRLEAGKILADPEFDEEDPDSAKIAGKVKRGYLKACSMGLIPLEVQLIDGEPWAVRSLALETSIVDAGSNANALRLFGLNGEEIKDTEKHILNLTFPIMDTKKDSGSAPEQAAPVVPVAIALAAGLAENATAELVAAKIKEISDENRTLKLAAETTKTTAIKDLLDKAITDKKILATERSHYEALAALNFDSVKAIVEKLNPPVDLVAHAQGGKTASVEGDEELVKKYNELDKSNKLYQLKASDLPQFKTLYKARFGVDFKEA
jgi:uncharacterized membrane protein